MRAAAVAPGQDQIVAISGNPNSATSLTYNASVWSSTDGGSTWVQIGQGSGSASLSGIGPLGIRFDPNNANVFWIFGGGVFGTTNGGQTFTAYPSLGDAEDVSVDSADNLVLASKHETAQYVEKSTDGGTTWTNIGANLPAGTDWSQYNYIIDQNTYLVGCSFANDGSWDTGGGTPGIYRTTDGGSTWTQVASYEVYSHPTADANGNLYWSYYNTSTNNGGIITSSDGGVTWTELTSSGLTYTVQPAVLPSQVASLSSSYQVYLFTPGGSAPTAVAASPLTTPYSIGYDAARNSLFEWGYDGGIYRLDLN